MQDWRDGVSSLFHSVVPQTASMIFTTAGGFIGVRFISELGLDVLAASNYISTIQSFTITTLNSAISYQTNRADNNSDVIAQGHVRNLQRSWCHSLVFSGVTIATMFAMVPVIAHFSGDDLIAAHVREYFMWFAPGVPAMFLLNSYRQMMLATQSAWSNLPFYLEYQVLDTFLSYAFVYGKLLLPKMGLSGLGLANTISIWATASLYTVYLHEKYANNGINIFEFRLKNKELMASIKALATESAQKFFDNFFYSLRIFSDQGLLFILSLMLGRMGSTQNAAQEAAFQYIPLFATFIYGLKDSIGKLVGNSRDFITTKRTAYLGLITALVATGIPFTIFLTLPDPLLKIFLHGNDRENQEILRIARHLLWINGAGLVCDGVRNNCLSTLNNFNVPRFPIILIGLAVAGAFLAYALGFHTDLEASGVMLARTLVIAIGAILSLALMLYYLCNPHLQQAANAESSLPVLLPPDERTALVANIQDAPSSVTQQGQENSSNRSNSLWQTCTSLFWGSNRDGAHINRIKIVPAQVTVNIPGLAYQEVPGDGQCLYNAVALYVGEEEKFLRNIVAAHLEHNIEAFREYIVLSTHETVGNYIQGIRYGKEWAANIDIEVLMRVLNRPIVVIGPENAIRNYADIPRFSGDPIFIYYNDHNHYDALIVQPGYNDRDILERLVSAYRSRIAP